MKFLQWLFGEKPKPATGPFHLFVLIRHVGLAYGGEFDTRDEAHGMGLDIIGHHSMDTGQVVVGEQWTTTRDAFTRDELAAFTASKTEAR